MKKIPFLISGIILVIIVISIIIGRPQNNTYTRKSLRKYQDSHRTMEVMAVPQELWLPLSNEYVVGQQATPFLIEGNKSWKPKRYFGNFQEGSELEQLQVVLNGMLGTFYHNNFFDGMTPEDQSFFKVYYRHSYVIDDITNVVLPNEQTPQKIYRDHKPILQVDTIDYSHKYGGSVVMKFELTDFYDENKEIVRLSDYGYEFRHLEYTYDIRDFVIRVYVIPRLTHFNPTTYLNLATSQLCELHVEITPKEVVAYKNGVIIKNFVNSSEYDIFDEFVELWEQSLAESLRGSGANYKNSLYIFAHAFSHYMHSTLLPPLTEKVTNLFLTDDFFDLTSEVYEGLAAVSWKIQGIDLWQYPEEDLELKVSYIVKYLHEDFKKEITRGKLELGTYEDSYYLPIGIFNENDLEEITGIEIVVKIKEDDLLFDDEYKTINILIDVADDIVKPKIASATGGPILNGLIIYDHEYLWASEQVEDRPGLYKLKHDLFEKGDDDDNTDGYMDSYLRIVIIKR